jgi:hypothetical protein
VRGQAKGLAEVAMPSFKPTQSGKLGSPKNARVAVIIAPSPALEFGAWIDAAQRGI